MPCLALKGVAAAIARSSSLRAKVLLCEYFCTMWTGQTIPNSFSECRKWPGNCRVYSRRLYWVSVRPSRKLLLSADHTCRAIVRTLNANYSTPPYGRGGANTIYPTSAFITDLVYSKGTTIAIDEMQITVSYISYRHTRSWIVTRVWVCDAERLKEAPDSRQIQLYPPWGRRGLTV
jgi:hypothetical protein